MKVRNATSADFNDIKEIYAGARALMRNTGNGTQWKDSYPPDEVIKNDIENKNLYVVCGEGGIQAVFAFIPGVDPTYLTIDGQWLNDEPYAAVHRVASAGKKKGMLKYCMEFAFSHCNNIKIDTHHNNKIMQHQLEKEGFTQCGIIITHNGEPRIAYQKIKE